MGKLLRTEETLAQETKNLQESYQNVLNDIATLDYMLEQGVID